MTTNKKELDGYFSVVATKISPTDKEKLREIAKRFGLSFYELLQALLLAIVRYFDTDSTFFEYERNVLINAIGNILESNKGSFSPLSMNGYSKQRAKSAILFIEREPEQKPQLLMVKKNGSNEITGNYNYDTMLTAFLEAADHNILQALKDKQKMYGQFSIMQTLHDVILSETDKDEKTRLEIQDFFSDVRIPTGQQINKETHYKRKKNRYGKDITNINKKENNRQKL